MSRWQHSDSDCPRRPILGLRNGRQYRCRCGRVWRYTKRFRLTDAWGRCWYDIGWQLIEKVAK